MRRQRGITLIELIVTMVVVGLLTAIAIPSYTSYMRKTRRADAKVALLNSAQQFERCYTRFNSYTPAAPNPVCVVLPYNTPAGTYTIDADPAAAPNPGIQQNSFALKATPIGNQAQDAHCGTFQLNQVNQQTTSSGAADCW